MCACGCHAGGARSANGSVRCGCQLENDISGVAGGTWRKNTEPFPANIPWSRDSPQVLVLSHRLLLRPVARVAKRRPAQTAANLDQARSCACLASSRPMGFAVASSNGMEAFQVGAPWKSHESQVASSGVSQSALDCQHRKCKSTRLATPCNAASSEAHCYFCSLFAAADQCQNRPLSFRRFVGPRGGLQLHSCRGLDPCSSDGRVGKRPFSRGPALALSEASIHRAASALPFTYCVCAVSAVPALTTGDLPDCIHAPGRGIPGTRGSTPQKICNRDGFLVVLLVFFATWVL